MNVIVYNNSKKLQVYNSKCYYNKSWKQYNKCYVVTSVARNVYNNNNTILI